MRDLLALFKFLTKRGATIESLGMFNFNYFFGFSWFCDEHC